MSEDIILTSGELVVSEIIRKTTAKLFKDLVVGDKIKLSVILKPAGTNRGQTYSTYIKVENLNNGEKVFNSFNQLPKLIDCFKFKKLEEI